MSTFSARLRRLQWKLGRRLYMAARGEPRSNLPDSSDERYLQVAVLTAAGQGPITVLDVGANKGQWSSQLLRLAPDALRRRDRLHLHAFEPVPATREVYGRTLAGTLGGDCATLHPLALSDATGTAEIAIWGETAGTNTLSFDDTSVTRAQQVLTIETATLDAFLAAQGIYSVSLLKIDAEGHDFRVLQGGGSARGADRRGAVRIQPPLGLCPLLPSRRVHFRAGHALHSMPHPRRPTRTDRRLAPRNGTLLRRQFRADPPARAGVVLHPSRRLR